MFKILFVSVMILASTTANAHGGGVDQNGCHNTKAGARHCHGENEGKYIPMTEEKRLQKLHKDSCNSIDAEGLKVRVDPYGKRCR
jgi:hypothetical protein